MIGLQWVFSHESLQHNTHKSVLSEYSSVSYARGYNHSFMRVFKCKLSDLEITDMIQRSWVLFERFHSSS